MKLLINLSVIHKGGGLQVAHSLLQELKNIPGNLYTIILLENLMKTVISSNFPNNFTFHKMDYSPSDLFRGYKTRRQLVIIEKRTLPDAVFTLFGPSYWKPRAPHLCGYALGHFVYTESPFYKIISRKEYLRLKILGYIKLRLLKNEADYFVTETDDVSERLANKIGVSRQKIFTVSNIYNGIFDQPQKWNNSRNISRKGFMMITISSFYSHKNLEIIPSVINYLKQNYPDFEFTFVLTIEQNELNQLTKEQKNHVRFIGKVSIMECPNLYNQVDALFLPTLLECFSASYLEAMKMHKPILTSNLSFASSICGDAALYFNPLSSKDIGDKIVKLARDSLLQKTLVKKGNKKLVQYGNAKQRAEKYLDIIEIIKESP